MHIRLPIHVSVGDLVRIVGHLGTTSDLERCLNASTVTVTISGLGSAAPLGMGGKLIGGSNLAYNLLTGAGQRGVKAWTWMTVEGQPRVHTLVDVPGPNNIGLLVKT